MITYEQFEHAMKKIQDSFELNGKLYELQRNYNASFFMENDPLDVTGELINVLILAADDVDLWIDWFVLENDFGKKKLEVRNAKDEVIPVNTIKELWDIIQEVKRLNNKNQ